MEFCKMGIASIVFFIFLDMVVIAQTIPTTLQGPFTPVTHSLDPSLRLGSDDLPMDNPRLKRNVTAMFPEQIALALSSSSSMWVSWVTGDSQIGLNVTALDPSTVASEVWYGKESGDYSMKMTGVSTVYSQLYPYEGLWNYTSGIIHHVKIDGLEPGTKYYYKCGDSSLPAMSDEQVFETLPSPGPNSYPRRIAVIGDLGLTSNSTTTIDHLIENDPSIVLMVGDLTYANQYQTTGGKGASCFSCAFPNAPIRETYQPRWDAWGRFMEPLTSRVPMMVIEGNHEIEPQAAGISFQSYLTRFAVPSNESGSNSNFYYSFDAGGAHFIMLGAYVDYNSTGAQYAWLKEDLSKIDRSVTPWLVAAWHSPWYNSYSSHYQEFECMRQQMEALLYQYRVDIVLSGHVHAYERMNRVYNYMLDPCGPVYITVGDGGNIEKVDVDHADDPGKCPSAGDNIPEFGGVCHLNFSSGPAKGNFCWDKQPEWSAYRESSFGHGILEVVNSTYALWTWHRNQDIYKENSSGDQIYIVRQPQSCSVPSKNSEITSSPPMDSAAASPPAMDAVAGFGVHLSGDAQVGLNVIPLDPSIVASEVWYGKESGKYPMKRRGVSMVYSQLYAFEGFWNYTSGIIHHVRIDGLEPGTKYYYRCGDGGFPAMSEEKVFETLPLPGPNSYPRRIAIIGDLGLTRNSTTTLDRVIKNDPSLLVIVGDLAYANQYLTTGGKGAACYPCTFPYSPVRETYQPRWDAWGRFMEPLISRVPMMVIEGNHEIEPQAAGISFQSYLTRFAVPSKESGSNTNFYYSFDAGGVHFIMLGAYVDYNRTGAQYAWLKEDLRNMDRSVTPWLVAAWHPPWYNSYKTHYQEFECMRQEMEALLYQYRVDIVFSGHVHAYERMNRVYNYTLDPCGPIYITVGDGGNIETADVDHADDKCPSTTEYLPEIGGVCHLNFSSGPAKGKFCWDRQPEWSAFRESSFGHGILEVVNSTYALWTWHRNQDEENSNGDQIYIVRQPHLCPIPSKPSSSTVQESEITSSRQSVETFTDQKTSQPMETAVGFGFHSSGVLIWYLLFFTFIFLHLFWTTCRRRRARRSARRAID